MEKAILGVIGIIASLSCHMISAQASDTINVNGNELNFSTMVTVQNGTVYIPLRQLFPVSEETNQFQNDNIIVQVIYEPEYDTIILSRADIINGVKSDDDKRIVNICWSSEIKEDYGFTNGRIRLLHYDGPQGNTVVSRLMDYETEELVDPNDSEHDQFYNLMQPLQIDSFDGNSGMRVLLSLEDSRKVAEFLVGDTDYNVQLD